MIQEHEFLREVPLFAIRALCRAAGRRNPKLPSGWWRSTTQHPNYGPHTVYGYTPPISGGKTGNLENGEYRYWHGSSEKNSNFSKCRMCSSVAMNAAARQDHQKTTQCCKNLVAVYKLMLSMNHPVCAVCGNVTHNREWGVPMCRNDKCPPAWKFHGYIGFPAFACFVSMARARGLLTEVSDGL